ncbi:ataxin-10 isoform X2 [Varanus komodoensis]|uniref:ataxin-10 isoform X2 n=1 Tax=Varanus komodoensis TaxID=61221 RepID=UPI001CF78E8A|nr:ataxin-10 isoform X2 [Varanus komodoensis]
MASIETLAGETLHTLAARLRSTAEDQAAACPDCLTVARQMTGLFRETAHREAATKSLFQNLQQTLLKISHEIAVVCKDTRKLVHLDAYLLLLSECFRCLRNACIQCENNQNIMRNLGLIDVSVHLIQLLQNLKTDLESFVIAFRCSFQFLGNIATGNKDSQNRIWELAFPSVFLNCLNYQDEKIVSYCSMVLFTCLNPERMIELQEENNLNVVLAILQASRRYPESEWVFLIVTNHLLKCPELVNAMYAKLSNQERTKFLELILPEMNENDSVMNKEIARFLACCFEEKCHAVLKLASATNEADKEALVTIQLLDLLCEMTSHVGQLECLQACPDLLKMTVNTLQLVHLSGKQNTNIFTATHSATGQEQKSHPAVGFKAHLIRLIGNLCYKNKANQDKVNRNGGEHRVTSGPWEMKRIRFHCHTPDKNGPPEAPVYILLKACMVTNRISC